MTFSTRNMMRRNSLGNVFKEVKDFETLCLGARHTKQTCLRRLSKIWPKFYMTGQWAEITPHFRRHTKRKHSCHSWHSCNLNSRRIFIGNKPVPCDRKFTSFAKLLLFLFKYRKRKSRQVTFILYNFYYLLFLVIYFFYCGNHASIISC